MVCQFQLPQSGAGDSISSVTSNGKPFSSKMPSRIFSLNIAAVCWHTVKFEGPTSFHSMHCLCSAPSIPSWRSTGRQRRELSFQGSAYPTEKAQLNADRNKSCSQKDVLSSIPSERTERAGFDRARRKSGSSKLDRTVGSYFLPTFDGSQLLSYLEPSQKHAYPAVQSCFSQSL